MYLMFSSSYIFSSSVLVNYFDPTLIGYNCSVLVCVISLTSTFVLSFTVYLFCLKTGHIFSVKTVPLLMLTAAVSAEEETEEKMDGEKLFPCFKLLAD